MASSTEDPILIQSDDEGSDNDDVVLIKEEIEVDTDDVIFLSETKPPPAPDSENSSAETSDGQDNGVTETKALNLSSSNSLISGINTAAADDLSAMYTYILGPLDLSGKGDTHNQSGNSDKSIDSDMQNDLDFIFGTDLYTNTNVSSSLVTALSNSQDATASHNKLQGPHTSSAIQCDTVSGSDNKTKKDTRSTGDICVNQTSDSSNATSSVMDMSSKIFCIDSLLGITSSSTTTSTSDSAESVTSSVTAFTMTDSQSLTGTKILQPLQPLSPKLSTGNQSSDTVSSSGSIDASQKLLKSSDPMWSSKDDDMVNKIKQSLMDSSLQTSSSQTKSSSSQSLLPSFVPYCPTGSQNSSQQQSYVPQCSDSVFSQTGCQTFLQTDPQISKQLSAAACTQSRNLTGSSLNQGLPGGSQLHTSQTLGLSNQSAFSCINSYANSQNSGGPQMKRSLSLTDQTYLYNPLTLPKSQKESYLRSFSSSDMNSWTVSDQNKRKSDNLALAGLASSSDTGAPASDGPYQLPPKKQRRCFIELKCINCKDNLSGEKCCKCPNGHATCAKCLEERVKRILTGKEKESIRCLNESCDSFYLISELKTCLPSMVVEILEDRLDQDYVDYFSSMMLKTALDEANGEGPAEMDGGEDEAFGPSVTGTAPKKPAETDPELPMHWEPMDEKLSYEMFTLDVNSEEYNQILPLFFTSMINHKVEVVNIRRIQNPILWKFYCVKKKEMLLDNAGFGAVNEQQLYHGTDTSVVDAICKKGFDWRVCGKNGTLYGQGTYFAAEASYSHQYTDIKGSRPSRYNSLIPQSSLNLSMAFGGNMSSQVQPILQPAFPPNPTASAINLSSSSSQTSNMQRRYMVLPVQSPSMTPKYKILPKPANIRSMSGMPTWPLEDLIEQKKQTTQMFVAKVLVGKYSGGSSKLRKPPPLDPKSDPFGKCYDSCVDNIHMPKIYVIFDSAQAYPEYLIEYTYD